MIAGTYTPLAYNLLDGVWRWLLLGGIWTVAAGGVIYKLFFKLDPGLGSLLFYIAMSWTGLLVAPLWLTLLPTDALLLFLAGGVVYMVGAVIFGLERPNIHPYFGFHELWHLLVLGGTGIHFVAIMFYIV